MLFVQILLIAKQAKWLKMGTISLDGTKMKANASKHKALSYKYACKLEAQLKAEVEDLLKKAEQADTEKQPEELSIPDELKRREDRLKVIADAKAEIERRAEERYQQDAEWDQLCIGFNLKKMFTLLMAGIEKWLFFIQFLTVYRVFLALFCYSWERSLMMRAACTQT